MTLVGLPVELIEHILSSCWAMSLSIDARVTLMTSSALVNSFWRAIFLRLSSRDVHIPSPAFADHFLCILSSDSVSNQCRSLTIHIVNKNYAGAPWATESPMEKALSHLLYRFHDTPASAVPNRRRISIHYRDMGFASLFNNWTLIAFPRQVTELELSYSFSSATPTTNGKLILRPGPPLLSGL
ncbi:hypothetical protein DFH06DRAFT_676941 [Mycena polygramma]|nr:hypothetical protein DFH06DRAFT_676941 [Mycena polygramma]